MKSEVAESHTTLCNFISNDDDESHLIGRFYQDWFGFSLIACIPVSCVFAQLCTNVGKLRDLWERRRRAHCEQPAILFTMHLTDLTACKLWITAWSSNDSTHMSQKEAVGFGARKYSTLNKECRLPFTCWIGDCVKSPILDFRCYFSQALFVACSVEWPIIGMEIS